MMDCVSSAFCFENNSTMDLVCRATASAMVLASAASLHASQSRLWSLLAWLSLISAAAASPSLVLSLSEVEFSVQNGHVLKKQCSLSYLIQLCCAGPRRLGFKMPFQVPFQVHLNILSSYVSNVM